MALVAPIEYDSAWAEVRAVYDDIRATRNTDDQSHCERLRIDVDERFRR
jgi:hypothetical protein